MNNSPSIASENLPAYAADSGARHVRLFKNGANQAVRIPKEFELPGKDAVMRREGNRLIIEAVKPPKGTIAALVYALDTIKHLGPVDEPFPDVDAGMLPLDDIVL
ncbi:MAG: virulence-associated protein VapB [Pseudomonadota bacterium]